MASEVERLNQIGVRLIATTRDGAAFEECIKHMLEESGALGVSCVLHSKSQEDYIGR